MKTAFSIWEQRIAPVLDTARHLYVVESEAKQIIKEQRHAVRGVHPSQLIASLSAQGIETLVCGAVSRFFQEQLTAAGVKVIPFITGELQSVIAAYLDGKLEQPDFLMPGCCGRKKRSCGGRRCHGGGNTL
jgi:predicted Fe-Mo cluster-binding NifX family protein